MIKVGDKFKGIDGREEVATSIWLNDKTVGVESGLAYSYEEVYKSWYEQQKQRADELEKQNDILKHNIRVELDSNRDMYIGMCEQKLRADRAEKRWSELRDKTIETYVGLRKMKSILAQHIGSILCVIDELEGKDNVFETVQRLEEDGE